MRRPSRPPSAARVGAATPAPEFPFVAIGIISAPTFIDRRAAIRATWLSHCSIGREIAARFVIRALNADMPYDQFVKWQIAGDELAPDNPEAMAATGFLGAGVYPTQITFSEAERIRFDATDDMLFHAYKWENVSFVLQRAWLGAAGNDTIT